MKFKLFSLGTLALLLFGLMAVATGPKSALADNPADIATFYAGTGYTGTSHTINVWPPASNFCDQNCLQSLGLDDNIESVQYGSEPSSGTNVEVKLWTDNWSGSTGYGVILCHSYSDLSTIPLFTGSSDNWANVASTVAVHDRLMADCGTISNSTTANYKYFTP